MRLKANLIDLHSGLWDSIGNPSIMSRTVPKSINIPSIMSQTLPKSIDNLSIMSWTVPKSIERIWKPWIWVTCSQW